MRTGPGQADTRGHYSGALLLERTVGRQGQQEELDHSRLPGVAQLLSFSQLDCTTGSGCWGIYTAPGCLSLGFWSGNGLWGPAALPLRPRFPHWLRHQDEWEPIPLQLRTGANEVPTTAARVRWYLGGPWARGKVHDSLHVASLRGERA